MRLFKRLFAPLVIFFTSIPAVVRANYYTDETKCEQLASFDKAQFNAEVEGARYQILEGGDICLIFPIPGTSKTFIDRWGNLYAENIRVCLDCPTKEGYIFPSFRKFKINDCKLYSYEYDTFHATDGKTLRPGKTIQKHIGTCREGFDQRKK